MRFKIFFPNASIYCFEPSQKNFETLKKKTSSTDNVFLNQMALGAENMKIEMFTNSQLSSMNSIINHSSEQNRESEQVSMETLGLFTERKGIDKIDYLKIDTEGYDLEVLKGARGMLDDQAISFIESELSMNQENDFHRSFEEVKEFIEGFGYRVFGVYEQVLEWPTTTPVLRRANVVFISQKEYESPNTRYLKRKGER